MIHDTDTISLVPVDVLSKQETNLRGNTFEL